jgi:hypothetical protein
MVGFGFDGLTVADRWPRVTGHASTPIIVK